MYDCIVSLKEWQLYCRSLLHGRTFVYEEQFQKANSDYFGKQKSWHATSVAIVWDSFGKILSPNVAEKMNGKHFEEIKSKP